MGTVQQRQFQNLGNNDGAQLSQNQGVISSAPWQPSNWVYRDNNNKTYAITGVMSLFGEQVGDPVCRAGITTGRQCGRILIVNYTQAIADDGKTVNLAGQVRTSACSLPGDSGGPFHQAGIGYGMNSAASFTTDAQGRPACYPSGDDRRFSTYSPLKRSVNAFDVTIRTNPQ